MSISRVYPAVVIQCCINIVNLPVISVMIMAGDWPSMSLSPKNPYKRIRREEGGV
jgi:hypothetical protein